MWHPGQASRAAPACRDREPQKGPIKWPGWLQSWFNNHINEGLTGVTATVEVAGSASNIKVNTLNLLFETGTAISLPAPEADGCGGIFSFFIDPLVNDLIDLPSPAGTNTAVLEGKLSTAEPAAVKASEP